jgi:hypothetical protein
MVMKEILKKGQAALIVLLVVAVALGFGISIISQATTDIRISQQEQEAARAFNAAEAGIEEALKALSVGSFILPVDEIEVEYTVTGETYLEGMFKENEAVQVRLGGANTLRIEWVDTGSEVEDPGSCVATSGQAPASLLISIIDNSNQIRRVGWNACGLNGDNGMLDVGGAGDDPYLRRSDLEVYVDDSLVRIRPVYNRTSLKVTGIVEDLPIQAYSIDSEAQTPTLEAKAIEVTRTEAATPAIFDYVLFSGTNIIK